MAVRRLPILTYHNLDETGSPVSVAPATFRSHLARLRAAGCTVLPLSEALARAGLGPGPAGPGAGERVVALTFDDGYAAVHRYALPVLATYGWRATVFPVSDYLGRDNRWPDQPAFVPPDRLLSWAELRELASAGWEVGAHTRTHPDLTGLDAGAVAAEVLGGKAVLEDRLGLAVRTFAYPYGRHDPRVRAVVSAAFAAACTTSMGIAGRRSDVHALERLDMWYFSPAPTRRLLASPWMGPFAAACHAGRRARAAARRVARSLPARRLAR
jgi:peptidoglycan/xylan/chitin deacetylase (PgdA/CDA1 family)